MPVLSEKTALESIYKYPGMMTRREMDALYHTVEWLGFDDGDILEIGTFCGRSACVLAASKDYEVTTIDPHEGWLQEVDGYEHSKGDTYKAAQFFIHLSGLENFIHPVVCSSEDFEWHGGGIILLLIDGLHTYENIKHDFEKFSPYVVSGGIVALHDYGTYECVKQFYKDEIEPSGEFYRTKLVDSLLFLEKG